MVFCAESPEVNAATFASRTGGVFSEQIPAQGQRSNIRKFGRVTCPRSSQPPRTTTCARSAQQHSQVRKRDLSPLKSAASDDYLHKLTAATYSVMTLAVEFLTTRVGSTLNTSGIFSSLPLSSRSSRVRAARLPISKSGCRMVVNAGL